MSWGNTKNPELTELLEAMCDDRLSPAQRARLEELVLSDRHTRRLYLEYIELHGTLCWDTAKGGGETPCESAVTTIVAGDAAVPANAAQRESSASSAVRIRQSQRRMISAAAVAALLIVGLTLFARQQFFKPHNSVNVAGQSEPTANREPEGLAPAAVGPRSDGGDLSAVNPDRFRPLGPIVERRNPAIADPAVSAPNPPEPVAGIPPQQAGRLASPVELIDEQLAAGWTLAGVEPSPRADDGEWIRRVYLDVTGRIPAVGDVENFLKDRRPDKRAQLIDRLLDDPNYVAHWTTIWANLLVGRAELPADVSRPALERFLRRSFAGNRPWSEIVFEIVSAEGDSRENGAANFLLAHLNNEAVPATAVTARLFLGTQVQCTQCHHHPFNDSTQDDFWALNSCFQQTGVVREREIDEKTGQPRQVTRLVNRTLEGPIFYSNRQNVMSAAFPKFAGVSIDPGGETNRRRELARLMIEGEQPQVARAMVNRMWQHFFGHGFTRPVDDMGPHNQATHPALLEQLTREFVGGGYDVKRLIRWICNSEAYQLTSRFGETNEIDDPAVGEMPLFSRMYVKSMTVEQLYDSLLVATRLDESRGSRWDETGRRRRQQWLQQFVVAFDTEENDETTTFDGTLPQALMMMNGELVQAAISAQGDTYLKRVVTSRGSESQQIRELFLAALSRYPTPKELSVFRKLLRERTAARVGNPRQVHAEGLQDLFWAFLNSSEFILVH